MCEPWGCSRLMRVIAATFRDEERARRVLELLTSAFQLGPDDAQVARLGTADVTPEAGTALLAGRFSSARTRAIRRILMAAGGEIVLEVDQRATQPRISGLASWAAGGTDGQETLDELLGSVPSFGGLHRFAPLVRIGRAWTRLAQR